MSRKTTHMKVKGAGLVLALAILAPAAAHGASTRYNGPERAVRTPALRGGNAVVAVRSSGRATFRRVQEAGRPSGAKQAGTAASRGGLGWREMGIGAGILIGIFLFGLWGDVVVGAVVVAVAALAGAGATLVARGTARGLRRAGSPASRVARPAADQPAAIPSSAR